MSLMTHYKFLLLFNCYCKDNLSGTLESGLGLWKMEEWTMKVKPKLALVEVEGKT